MWSQQHVCGGDKSGDAWCCLLRPQQLPARTRTSVCLQLQCARHGTHGCWACWVPWRRTRLLLLLRACKRARHAGRGLLSTSTLLRVLRKARLGELNGALQRSELL